MDNTKKWFGEYAEYEANDEIEKSQAKQYLILWKKFFLRKLQKDTYSCEVLEEHWTERGPEYSGILHQRSSIGLKLCVKANFNYDLERIR